MKNIRQTILNIKEQNGKVLVIGLGISGIETAKFFIKNQIFVLCCEKLQKEIFAQKSKYGVEVETLGKLGTPIYFGVDGENIDQYLEGVALVVLSPGVPLNSTLVTKIKDNGIPYICEFELGIELSNRKSIVITGSNGKSTTVSLIDHILREAKFDSLLVGNIGTPIISTINLDETGSDGWLVVEASSYQLESCSYIKPKIAGLLNLSENHLERHKTMGRYLEAKARLFLNQDNNDFCVLNKDDDFLKPLFDKYNSQHVMVGSSSDVDIGIFYEPNKDIDYIRLNKTDKLHLESSRLLGLHNRYNIAFAAAIADKIGVPFAKIQEAVLSFKPLQHRVEVVKAEKGIWINDSKSTTVASSVAALLTVLSHWPKREVILMLGGQLKESSWQPLLDVLSVNKSRIKHVICFGNGGPYLERLIAKKHKNCSVENTVKEAVSFAKEIVHDNSVVLFTPGGASFDEFKGFDERGEKFAQWCAD